MQNLSDLLYSLSVTTWNQFIILMSYKTQLLLKIDTKTGSVSIIPKPKNIGFCRNIYAFGDKLYLFEQTKNRKAVEYDLRNETIKIYENKTAVIGKELLGYWPVCGEKVIFFHSKESNNISIFDIKEKKWNELKLSADNGISFTEGGFITDNKWYLLDARSNLIYYFDRDERITEKLHIISKDEYDNAFWLSYNQEIGEFIILCKKSDSIMSVMKGKRATEDQIEFLEICSFKVNCEPEKAFVPVSWKKNLYLIPVYADTGLLINLEKGTINELKEITLMPKGNNCVKTNYAEGTILNGIYCTVHLSTGLLNCIDLETSKVEKKELSFNENEKNKYLKECLENNGIAIEGLVDLSGFIQHCVGNADYINV